MAYCIFLAGITWKGLLAFCKGLFMLNRPILPRILPSAGQTTLIEHLFSLSGHLSLPNTKERATLYPSIHQFLICNQAGRRVQVCFLGKVTSRSVQRHSHVQQLRLVMSWIRIQMGKIVFATTCLPNESLFCQVISCFFTFCFFFVNFILFLSAQRYISHHSLSTGQCPGSHEFVLLCY